MNAFDMEPSASARTRFDLIALRYSLLPSIARVRQRNLDTPATEIWLDSKLPTEVVGGALQDISARQDGIPLVRHEAGYHPLEMFLVTEADAEAIRAIFNQEGELSAAIEPRRRFPGITDNAKARMCARTIAGWKPPPNPPGSVIQMRPRGTKARGL
jgi:hypothetical protein